MARRSMRTALAAVLMGLVVVLAGCGGAPSARESYRPGELSGVPPNFGVNMQACLADAGWDVDVTSDGGVQTSIPEESEGVYDAAVADCQAEFGYDKAVELTDAQYGKLHAALIELVRCLSDEGFTVTDVPSKQAFTDGALFDPYGELYDTNQLAAADFETLQRSCPQP